MNGLALGLGVLFIVLGLASVFLSIIPSIENAIEVGAEAAIDPTKEKTVKAGEAIAWAIITWYFTIALTILAFVGGVILFIFGVVD